MIQNEQEYQVTLYWIQQFREAVDHLDAHPPADMEPWSIKLLRDSYASEVEALQRQVDAYDTGIPEPPRELTAEQQKLVAQARKDFAERFGEKAKWALEEVERAIP